MVPHPQKRDKILLVIHHCTLLLPFLRLDVKILNKPPFLFAVSTHILPVHKYRWHHVSLPHQRFWLPICQLLIVPSHSKNLRKWRPPILQLVIALRYLRHETSASCNIPGHISYTILQHPTIQYSTPLSYAMNHITFRTYYTALLPSDDSVLPGFMPCTLIMGFGGPRCLSLFWYINHLLRYLILVLLCRT